MITPIITFAVLVAGVLGWGIFENKRLDTYAKDHEDEIREMILQEIDRAGLSISDFPKYEDALKGDRYIKPSENIDILYTCRVRGRSEL